MDESNPVTHEGVARAASPKQMRYQLALGAQFDKPVADALARSIASTNIFLNDWARDVAGPINETIQRAMRDITAPYAAMAENLRTTLAQAIQPTALLAVSRLGEQLRDTSKTTSRYENALLSMGWWLPPSMPASQFFRIGRLAEAGSRAAVRNAVVELGRSRLMAGFIDGWMDCEAFAERRRFFLDGLEDHRKRRFRVSVPTLLPHVEGIAVREFSPAPERGTKNLIINAIDVYKGSLGDALAEAATCLYLSDDLANFRPTALNRHFILHGRSLRYGTEVNSVRVFFALDLLHSLVQDKVEQEAKARKPT